MRRCWSFFSGCTRREGLPRVHVLRTAQVAAQAAQAAVQDVLPDVAPKRSFVNQTVRARVVKVHDGDTVSVVTRLTDTEQYATYALRLFGLDTPELRPCLSTPPKLRELHIRAAQQVSTALCARVHGKEMLLICAPREEKYGRLLGTLLEANARETVNAWLLRSNMAKPYAGGARLPWTEEELLRALEAAGASAAVTDVE